MKLRVGHRTYSVSAFTETERSAAENASGLCLKTQGVIKVWTGAAPDDQADTLLHEVLHAVWDAWALPETPCEETAVASLAHGLLQVIRDNPQFLQALQNGLEGAPVLKDARQGTRKAR